MVFTNEVSNSNDIPSPNPTIQSSELSSSKSPTLSSLFTSLRLDSQNGGGGEFSGEIESINHHFGQLSLKNFEFAKQMFTEDQSPLVQISDQIEHKNSQEMANYSAVQSSETMADIFLEKPVIVKNFIDNNTNMLQNLANNLNFTQKLTSQSLVPESALDPMNLQQTFKSFSNTTQNRPVFIPDRFFSEPHEIENLAKIQYSYAELEKELGIRVNNLTLDEIFRNYQKRSVKFNSFQQESDLIQANSTTIGKSMARVENEAQYFKDPSLD